MTAPHGDRGARARHPDQPAEGDRSEVEEALGRVRGGAGPDQPAEGDRSEVEEALDRGGAGAGEDPHDG